MSLSWDEKVTELIQRFCDNQISLVVSKRNGNFVVTGTKEGKSQEAQSDDLVIALMLLAGMNPSPSDRQDYDPSEE